MKLRTLQLTTKMIFFHESDNSMIVDTFKQLLNGRESATVTFQTRSLGAARHDKDNHHHRRHSIPRSLAAARETKTMYTRPLIITRYQFPFRLSAHNFISTAPLVHCFVVCLLPFRAESSRSVILLRCPPPYTHSSILHHF